jgi:hypothetical protein
MNPLEVIWDKDVKSFPLVYRMLTTKRSSKELALATTNGLQFISIDCKSITPSKIKEEYLESTHVESAEEIKKDIFIATSSGT